MYGLKIKSSVDHNRHDKTLVMFICDLRLILIRTFILACFLTVKICEEINLGLLQMARVHIAKIKPGPDLTENKEIKENKELKVRKV